ncbi:MAG: HD-GYP domain-containing protein [Actinomycetota bacterium]|nr:HD-GYP domain-containing protein [Actinomycetota bacterium]
MATSSVSGVEREGRDESGRRRLVEILDLHGDELASMWTEAAGAHVNRWPQFDRYLRRLIAGLAEVFKGMGWGRTQAVIDELAQLRASSGVGLEQSLQKALLEGRRAVRPLCPDSNECEELMLEVLHECVFRFSESYQGLRLASESDRMHTRIIKSLVMSLEARDPYTKGHSLSVALLSQRIAGGMGPQVDPCRVYLAGLLHDVGKIGIPDNILLKAGPLDREEWEVMKSHPIVGGTILKPIKLYADVVSAVLTHHENYDGSGYPYGIAGADIPPISRILRVADSFDAMTTTRAHRPSRTADEAIAEITSASGTTYDPEAVEAFSGVIDQPGVMSELSLASLQIDLGEFVL